MVSPPQSARAADPDVATESPVRTRRMRLHGDDRWILAVALLVLAPLGVMLINLVGTHWFPASDQALEVLRIGDVGGRRTPLVGVQSRFGWDHPGPLLFWWSAPFRWVFGNTGVLFGIGLLNGAAITGSVLVARRRGGLPLVVAFAVVFLALLQGLGIDMLVDPWNPWVAVVPFLLYLLLAWSLAERDYALLPWLVAVGTFLVQTHVGYAPLVGGITVVAIALAAFGHPRVAEAWTPSTLRRDLRRALVVGVVLWLPALIEQVTGSSGQSGRDLRLLPEPVRAHVRVVYQPADHGQRVAPARSVDHRRRSRPASASASPGRRSARCSFSAV